MAVQPPAPTTSLACPVIVPKPTPLGVVTADLLQGTLQLLFAAIMIDAAEDFSDKLAPFAERATAKAKTSFASTYTANRALDAGVHGAFKGLPEYGVCTNHVLRGWRTGAISGANLVKSQVGNTSRYNCGSREEQILGALSGGIITSGEMAATARNYEESLVTSYFKLKYTALAASSGRQQMAGTSSFGDSAQTLINQAATFNQAAYNAVTGFVSTFGMYSRGQNKGSVAQQSSLPAGDTATPYQPPRIQAFDLG